MPDTMEALTKLYQLDGKKVADGTASEEEKTRHRLNDDLRSGRLPMRIVTCLLLSSASARIAWQRSRSSSGTEAAEMASPKFNFN